MELGLGLVGGIALTIAVTRGWKWAKRHADRPRVVKLGRVLVWFIAAVLVVVVLALLWLTCLAVASVTAQADWVVKLASLGPLATACAAAVALLVGWATIVQKRHSDRRDQWWKRAQWALDHASTAGVGTQGALRRKVGQNAIAYLGRESGFSALDDLEFLQAAYPATLVHDVETRLEASGIKDGDLNVEVADGPTEGGQGS